MSRGQGWRRPARSAVAGTAFSSPAPVPPPQAHVPPAAGSGPASAHAARRRAPARARGIGPAHVRAVFAERTRGRSGRGSRILVQAQRRAGPSGSAVATTTRPSQACWHAAPARPRTGGEVRTSIEYKSALPLRSTRGAGVPTCRCECVAFSGEKLQRRPPQCSGRAGRLRACTRRSTPTRATCRRTRPASRRHPPHRSHPTMPKY